MRLSTSTCLFPPDWATDTYTPTREIIRRCHDAGFRVMDMNFCYLTRGKTECAGDDWKERMKEIRGFADSLGVEFSQSHLPYYPKLSPVELPEKPGFLAYFNEMVMRALEASAILGVKWAVVHPFMNTVTADQNEAANLEMNLAYYTPLLRRAREIGVGLAIENMAEYRPELHRRYCSTAGELAKLIDQFGDPYVGACWDFGHANNVYSNQTGALRQLGKRLKATHVDDNSKEYDAHLAPFMEGCIDWTAVMKTLTEIGYEGDFTYEIHGMTKNAPDSLRDIVAKFCFDIGDYCLRLA